MQQRARWADVKEEHEEEMAAVQEREGRPQRELSQNEEWYKVESTGTEGDENIGSAREAFEPRERRNSNGGKIKKTKQIKENRQASRS